MAEKQKIITIIADNNITETVYGTVEISVPEINTTNKQNAARQYQRAQTQKSALMKKRAENTKHK